MATNKVLNDKLRELYLEKIGNSLSKEDEDVLRVGSNELAIPCLDEEGNEKFIVITIKVPTGSRDGDAYDGYSMAEDWEIKCKNKEETVRKKTEEKAKKIAKDKKMREKKKGE